MTDIRYIYREWLEQLDALEELISGWVSIRDSLQTANNSLEDIDRDIDDKDEDRAIAFRHSNLRDEIDALCDNYKKLKNYCQRIGDVIRKDFLKDLGTDANKLKMQGSATQIS